MVTFAPYLSKGIYSTSDAARLLGTDAGSVRRWAFGYRRAGEEYEAAIHTELPQVEGRYALTFLEFVELFSVKEMREIGLSWQKIRQGLATARRLLRQEHPFATRRWFAEPAGLFVELSRGQGEEVLIELFGHGQIAIKEALADYLEQLEFGPDQYARRWNPRGAKAPIVVDPELALGQPVVRGTATETAVLYRMFEGGEDIDRIAWAYELDQADVEKVIEFEASLAG